MVRRYLLDTNAIIDFCALLFPATSHQQIAQIIDEGPILSIINKIELLSFSPVPTEIIRLTEQAVVLNLNEQVADRTIFIRKTCKIKLPDAIIAATALEYDLILVTRNVGDFTKIEGLELFNPYTPEN